MKLTKFFIYVACGFTSAFAQATTIDFSFGVTAEGEMTPEWTTAIAARNTSEEVDRFAREKKPFAASEQDWIKLLKSEAEIWKQSLSKLQLPFPKISAPQRIVLLMGNRGGDDSFTYGDNTIAMDVHALVHNYGTASALENRDRVSRILSHEYTHLLHKVWLVQNPVKLETPLDRALWECLYEGIGNYRSLSDRWVSKDGTITSVAKDTLKKLTPVFVDRLRRLASANPNQERELTAGLSSGKFEEKWGALPVALWLAQEAGGNDAKLAEWVDLGPAAVFMLARKYLPSTVFADRDACLIISDVNSGKILIEHNTNRCGQRFSPCSSFKIKLSNGMAKFGTDKK